MIRLVTLQLVSLNGRQESERSRESPPRKGIREKGFGFGALIPQRRCQP